MNVVSNGRFLLRLSRDPDDLSRALMLRQRCFRPNDPGVSDRDEFDAVCQHLLVEDRATGKLAACCRLMILPGGFAIEQSYSARNYDLRGLQSFAAPMMEIGRFCIAPGSVDPDILRLAWAGLAKSVEAAKVEFLFGCSSFPGVVGQDHCLPLAYLAAGHLGPEALRPARKAGEIFAFGQLASRSIDVRAAMAGLPPMLRSYVAMGGWVSDHAVVDRDLMTLHVFTGLAVAAIPPARARLMRDAAAKIALA